jgi:hypothetical protein
MEDVLYDELDKAEEAFISAQTLERLRRQALHESDGDCDDQGDLEKAASTKELREATILAQAVEYQERARDCDGSACKLAEYVCQKVVKQDLNPGQ